MSKNTTSAKRTNNPIVWIQPSMCLGTGFLKTISIKTNTDLAPSSDGTGKTLKTARFADKSGRSNKKYSIPISLISAICETAVIVPPASETEITPLKSPKSEVIINPQR